MGPGPELSTVPDAGVQKPGFSVSLCPSPRRPSGIPSQRPGQKRVKSPGLPGRGGGAGVRGVDQRDVWGNWESSHLGRAPCPSSVPKPQTPWQQENRSGSQELGCVTAPPTTPTRPRGLPQAGEGRGGGAGQTEAASSPQARSGLAASHCFPGPLVPFCRFVNLRGLELGAAPLGRSLAAGVLVPRVARGGALQTRGGCGGQPSARPPQAPRGETCNSRKSPPHQRESRASLTWPKGRRRKTEGRGEKSSLRAPHTHTGREQWIFLLMQKAAIQNDAQEAQVLRALQGQPEVRVPSSGTRSPRPLPTRRQEILCCRFAGVAHLQGPELWICETSDWPERHCPGAGGE